MPSAQQIEITVLDPHNGETVGTVAVATADDVARAVGTAREARLGLELLDALEATGACVPPALWMQALRAAAQDDYVGMGRSDSGTGEVALERAWRRSVTEGGMLPDEGLVLHVLHAAGRAGAGPGAGSAGGHA